MSRRRFRRTTPADPQHAVAPNVLARQFQVAEPNRVWATDVTYLRTDHGWLYLAVLLDLVSRRVVGWALTPRLDRQLVLTALDHALRTRRPPTGLLHHSGRGHTYTSGEYQDRLTATGIRISMSRRGDCWDNAVVESFFATLKRELVAQEHWITQDDAARVVREYLTWHNLQRRHSAPRVSQPSGLRGATRRSRRLTQVSTKSGQDHNPTVDADPHPKR
ncbi:MAG: IS3 family transposase [Gemmatimonadales bacterium]